MTSHWNIAPKLLSLCALSLAVAYVARQLDLFDVQLLGALFVFLVALTALPAVLRGSAQPLPDPGPQPAPDQPTDAVPYDMTEAEWIRGKLLYRGVHNAAGMALRVGRTILWGLLIYLLFAALDHALRGGGFFRIPATAVLALVATVAVYVLLDNLFGAPADAARTFRARGPLWWPATIGWSADAIFIRNGEGYFRYALADCRAWKEDEALILLYTADNRYWCLPKHALLDAGRLESFERLLQGRVAKISPYKVVYRWR